MGLVACLPTPASAPDTSPTVVARITPTATAATPTPTSSTAIFVGENAVLGYRITLPATYRRSGSTLFRGDLELLGRDSYTFRTEAQERADCLIDLGDIPPPSAAEYLGVEAYRNPAGLTAADWARAHPQFSSQRTVEATTVGGRDAARVTQLGDVHAYVIAANTRMYAITPYFWPTPHDLDRIAASFQATTPAAIPSPIPSPSPRGAADATATALAAAFSARDSDAVALLLPSCHFGFSATIGGVPQGSAVNRSVALFTQALRDRFADRAFAVRVDATLQPRREAAGAGNEFFFVRSQWIEADRTTQIELDIGQFDGDWRWFSARHYYDRLTDRGCIPYRSPWVASIQGC